MKNQDLKYSLLFGVLALALMFVLVVNSASQSRIKGKCNNRETSVIEIDRTGNISYLPCDGKSNLFNGVTDFTNSTINGIINGKPYNTLDGFNNATFNSINSGYYTVNDGLETTQYRLGSPKSFFEVTTRPLLSSRNQVRLRTDETNPCCGGFAEFWLFSDTTHSYAYVRAQRNFQVRSDDFFVSNFKDNNKFKMFLNMDATETHPLEDTSRFRVGNFTDLTNFIDLENVTNRLTMQAGNVLIKPTSAAPATATTACLQGEIKFDSDFIYYCITNNNWKRAALTIW